MIDFIRWLSNSSEDTQDAGESQVVEESSIVEPKYAEGKLEEFARALCESIEKGEVDVSKAEYKREEGFTILTWNYLGSELKLSVGLFDHSTRSLVILEYMGITKTRYLYETNQEIEARGLSSIPRLYNLFHENNQYLIDYNNKLESERKTNEQKLQQAIDSLKSKKKGKRK